MSPECLYALARYENDISLIIDGIDQLSLSDGELDVSACIRAYGHLARRFGYFDRERTREIIARGSRIDSSFIESIIIDLREDLALYLDEEI